MSPRRAGSPYRYDRAAIRIVLETQGRDAALARWPRKVVDPIARLLGLVSLYRHQEVVWKPEQVVLLGTKPDSVLAAGWGMAHSTVVAYRRRLGIPTCDAKSYRDARRAALASISDAELNGTLESLQQQYGLAHMDLTAERKRRALALTPRQGRRCSAACNRLDARFLRAEAVVAIRRAHADATLQQIADAVGCTRERVRQILYLHETTSRAAVA